MGEGHAAYSVDGGTGLETVLNTYGFYIKVDGMTAVKKSKSYKSNNRFSSFYGTATAPLFWALIIICGGSVINTGYPV